MKFVSQYAKYKLWIVPSYYTTDGMGRKTFVPGMCAKFDQGVLETEDPVMIEALLKDPVCGRDYAPVKIASDTVPVPELADTPKSNNYAWAKAPVTADKTDGMFPCPTCEKRCKTKLALSGHMRTHR